MVNNKLANGHGIGLGHVFYIAMAPLDPVGPPETSKHAPYRFFVFVAQAPRAADFL